MTVELNLKGILGTFLARKKRNDIPIEKWGKDISDREKHHMQ